MTLYQKYSYEPSFCAFHKLLIEVLRGHLEEGISSENKYLLISKYLNFSIVDYSSPQSEEDKDFYPLSDLLVDGTINMNLVDELAYKHIILPSYLPLRKLETLIDYMKRDYRKGLFPKVFNPFFKWKLGEIYLEQITIAQVFAMKLTVDEMMDKFEEKHPYAYDIHDNFMVDDPWQATRGFKEDKFMVAYLQYLDVSLTNLQVMKMQSKQFN